MLQNIHKEVTKEIREVWCSEETIRLLFT